MKFEVDDDTILIIGIILCCVLIINALGSCSVNREAMEHEVKILELKKEKEE